MNIQRQGLCDIDELERREITVFFLTTFCERSS